MAHFSLIVDRLGKSPVWEHTKDDGTVLSVLCILGLNKYIHWTAQGRAGLSSELTASQLVSAMETASGESVTFDTTANVGTLNPTS